jgi:ADP-ribose pyrophosphatase YjhB (NUDIX family)
MTHETTPIHKVGIVVLRRDADEARVLLVRPKAKQPGDQAPWVLPRGTRQYQDPETGQWWDARKQEEALAHAQDEWESFAAAASREVEEEAGVPPALLQQRGLKEMGARDYHAPGGAIYPVYWFRLELKREDMAKLTVPVDAEEVGWFTLKEMEEAAAYGKARPGYVAVVKEAMVL